MKLKCASTLLLERLQVGGVLCAKTQREDGVGRGPSMRFGAIRVEYDQAVVKSGYSSLHRYLDPRIRAQAIVVRLT